MRAPKYWLGVLNDLKARGVRDILVCCVDGLSDFCDAIFAVHPQTDIQRCIIHQIRFSSSFVVSKNLKGFVSDLKKVYRANAREEAWEQLDAFDSKWGKKYPSVVKGWRDNRDEPTSFFQYPYEMRGLIYTTHHALLSKFAYRKKNGVDLLWQGGCGNSKPYA